MRLLSNMIPYAIFAVLMLLGVSYLKKQHDLQSAIPAPSQASRNHEIVLNSQTPPVSPNPTPSAAVPGSSLPGHVTQPAISNKVGAGSSPSPAPPTSKAIDLSGIPFIPGPPPQMTAIPTEAQMMVLYAYFSQKYFSGKAPKIQIRYKDLGKGGSVVKLMNTITDDSGLAIEIEINSSAIKSYQRVFAPSFLHEMIHCVISTTSPIDPNIPFAQFERAHDASFCAEARRVSQAAKLSFADVGYPPTCGYS